ncbi:hypothetical protein RI129_012188 [Pyrocoelia pectoralis]|uniref:Variable lymphocyte receptor A n=1 Tax=Pyrocoelia pectoralis TaxID=417401 RepID=A0AAN7ZGK3_9COLE
MKIWVLFLLLCVAAIVFAVSTSFCPDMCHCPRINEAHCSSIQFIKKIHFKNQFKSLFKLDVSNASITKMNINFNVLPNLKYLNLSWNKIQQVSPPFLPHTLEILDLSYNYIKYMPRNLHMLPKLKEVFFQGNPTYCDCDSVSVLDELIKNHIIVHPPRCQYPKGYKGVMLQSIKCHDNLFSDMQGDAPYEGSGYDDIQAPKQEEMEREFIVPGVTTAPDVVGEVIHVEEEGSGSGSDDVTPIPDQYDDGTSPSTDEYDYGSNDNVTDIIEPIIMPVNRSDLGSVFVKPCNFDCSTPFPIDSRNETDESPSPNLLDGLLIVANDLGLIDEAKNGTSTQAPNHTVEQTSEAETIIEHTTDRAIGVGEEKSGKITTEEESQSKTSYIFLGVFLIGILGIILYVMVKRFITRRNNRAPQPTTDYKSEPMEEVELLAKPPVDNGNQNGTPEMVPLINGNKDNKSNEEDDNIPDVKEPEPKIEDGVELRKPPRKNIPVPSEMKRVTIKAGEIPNSTPKTPVLVTRHLNSDGDIITTPNLDQEV